MGKEAQATDANGNPIDSFQTTAAFTADSPGGGGGGNQQQQKNSVWQADVAKDDYCLTSGCVKTAAEIIKNMDREANPCSDFYQFACGGFMERTSIPDDRTRMSSFSVLGDELLTQVRMLLEEESYPGEPKPFRMAKDVYKSCMDKDRIEELGVAPLKGILRELGGWPVLEGSNWSGAGYIW